MGKCDSIRAGLEGLRNQRDNLQQALDSIVVDDWGSLQHKEILWKEIQNLEQQITATNAALAACLKGPAPIPPAPPAFVKAMWNEEGPGPGVLNISGFSKVAGAIQALACDPINSDRVFVGTVGGGIWLSNDAASAPSPNWVPQTDFQQSLCMSAIAMSPLDPTGNTLYAGFGITSHSGIPAGPVLGILKTTDGGATWHEFARNVFQNNRITRILPTGLSTSKGEIVLAATLSGLFRSDDGGVFWTPVADTAVAQFANTVLCDVTSELGHPKRVYVASMTNVFRSDDGGDTQWTDVTPPQFIGQNTSWIRLSVGQMPDSSGNNWIHAGAQVGLDAFAIVSSSNLGAQWQSAGQPPNGAKVGALLVASPLLPTIFFCADDPTASHWMVDASTGQWTLVDNAGGNGTATHTDGRDMQFSASADVLFEVNDGGIYRLINPHGRPKGHTRQWEEAVGNLRITEFYSIAYDSMNHIIFGAAQDNSIPHQTTPGEIDWELNEGPENADGTRVGADNLSFLGLSVHVHSSQHLNSFTRETFVSAITPVVTSSPTLLVNNAGGLDIRQFEGVRKKSIPFVPSWFLSRADPGRILFGTDCLYESRDSGNTLEVLGGVTPGPAGPVPTNLVGTVTACAYGHKGNPDIIYVGAGGNLFVRQSGTSLPTMANAYPGSTPTAIVLAPSDWRLAYVLDDQHRVWRTQDAGASLWGEITGNLKDLTDGLNTIELYTPSLPSSAEVIFVGGLGGVFATRNPGTGRFAFWQKYGQNFPNTLVTDLHYDVTDDILVAGTLGRSAWSVRNVWRTILNAPSLRILGKGPSSCFGGWVENSNFVFSADIQGLAFLAKPLSFQWSVQGIGTTPPLTGSQLVVVMPAAGNHVAVKLTVTDAEGYKLFAYLEDDTITTSEAQFREKLCQILHEIQTIAQINWPIDPLGPPIRLGDPVAVRHSMEQLRRLTVDMTKVLGQLLHAIE